jgi:hypothetical protein
MPRSSDKDLGVEEKMSDTVTPGPTANAVRAADGKVLTVPNGWPSGQRNYWLGIDGE